MVIITKFGEGVIFNLIFFQILQHRFANVTQVLLCKSNQEKLENMKNDLNDARIRFLSFNMVRLAVQESVI